MVPPIKLAAAMTAKAAPKPAVSRSQSNAHPTPQVAAAARSRRYGCMQSCDAAAVGQEGEDLLVRGNQGRPLRHAPGAPSHACPLTLARELPAPWPASTGLMPCGISDALIPVLPHAALATPPLA